MYPSSLGSGGQPYGLMIWSTLLVKAREVHKRTGIGLTNLY